MLFRVICLIALGMACELIACYLTSRIFRLKYPVFFWVAHMSIALVGAIIRFSGLVAVAQTVILVLLYFVLPIACSEGKLLTRFIRCLVVILTTAVVDLAGDALLFTLVPSLAQAPVNNVLDLPEQYAFGMYAFIIPTQAAVSFFVAYLFDRIDHIPGEVSNLPVVLQLAYGFALYEVIVLTMPETTPLFNVTFFTVYSFFLVASSAVLIFESKKELAVDQALVVQEAAVQQIAQLKESAARLEEHQYQLRALRHDLANQIDFITELAKQGDTTRAIATLDTVRNSALKLCAFPDQRGAFSTLSREDVAIETAYVAAGATATSSNAPASGVTLAVESPQHSKLPLLVGVIFVLNAAAVLSTLTMVPTITWIVISIAAAFMLASFGVDAVTYIWLRRSLAKRKRAFESQTVLELRDSLENTSASASEIEAAISAAALRMLSQLDAAEQEINALQADSAKNHLLECSTIGRSATFRDCDNAIVSAVLSVKRRQCQEQGVALRCLTEVPRRCSIPDDDLAAIFFNLVDNAMRGTAELCAFKASTGDADVSANANADANKQSTITVRCGTVSGSLSIAVENPCLTSADAKHGSAKRKADTQGQHGLGTSIVTALAAKHHGTAVFENRNGIFVATVLLPLMN